MGGSGAAGGVGGTVSVTAPFVNAAPVFVRTEGISSAGIIAQSIGGGGGNGGSSTSASVGLGSASIAVGGSGGSGAIGGNVNIGNDDVPLYVNIGTTGDFSAGISASSIGGGGGSGGSAGAISGGAVVVTALALEDRVEPVAMQEKLQQIFLAKSQPKDSSHRASMYPALAVVVDRWFQHGDQRRWSCFGLTLSRCSGGAGEWKYSFATFRGDIITGANYSTKQGDYSPGITVTSVGGGGGRVEVQYQVLPLVV